MLFLFTPQNRTEAVQRVYANCRAKPALHLLDPFRHDKLSCSKMYSNPEYYYEETKAIQETFTKMASFKDSHDTMMSRELFSALPTPASTKKTDDQHYSSSQTLGLSADALEPTIQPTEFVERELSEKEVVIRKNSKIVQRKTSLKTESLSDHPEKQVMLENITESVIVATASEFQQENPHAHLGDTKPVGQLNQGFLNDIRNLQVGFELRNNRSSHSLN